MLNSRSQSAFDVPRWCLTALVVTIVVVVGVILYRVHSKANDTRTGLEELDIEVGDILCHPRGASWTKGGTESIVLFTSATCGVCNANRAFEDTFIGAAHARGTRLYAVIAVDRAHDALSKRLQERGLDVIRADPHTLGVSKVPSFFVVDDQSRVRSRWIGSVPSERRAGFLDDLLRSAPFQHYDRVGRKTFEMTYKHRLDSVQLLALHNAPPRYIEIPPAQLKVRAEYELERDKTVLVDCATATNARECQDTALQLAVMGFRHVVAIDLPHRQGAWVDRKHHVLSWFFE